MIIRIPFIKRDGDDLYMVIGMNKRDYQAAKKLSSQGFGFLVPPYVIVVTAIVIVLVVYRLFFWN